ncbi:MAG: sulfotransferase family 2 domain-containing protein [Gammaproteobacteria bacterium]|nr:sulfotransferase family 2 domain-containing protein [Gammaproteobacteria bacterium]
MTIVSHKHRFIFVCPRKVAGTSIRLSLAQSCAADDTIVGGETFRPGVDADDYAALRERNAHGYSTPHTLPDDVRRKVGERVWNDYFKFTVVRNPWDLFVSLYCYKFAVDWPNLVRDAGGVLHRGGLANARAHLNLRRARRRFLRGRHREGIEFVLGRGLFARVVDEIPAFCFSRGEPFADRYLRFENLQDDYDEVCRLLRLPHRALIRTKTGVRDRGRPYRDYYTGYSRDFIARRCAPMADAFGYRFD